MSARDIEAILNRHNELDDIEPLPATAAATPQKAKAANTKCVPEGVIPQSLERCTDLCSCKLSGTGP